VPYSTCCNGLSGNSRPYRRDQMLHPRVGEQLPRFGAVLRRLANPFRVSVQRDLGEVGCHLERLRPAGKTRPHTRLVCQPKDGRRPAIRSLLCAVGDLAGGAEGTGPHQTTRLGRGRVGGTLATEAACDSWSAPR